MSQMRALTDTPPGVSPAQMRGLIDERLRAAGHDPSALYQELEMDSPYVDTHDDVSRTMDTVNLHSHTFYELLFVRGGSLQYLLDTRRYRLQAGDIVFIPPNTSHRPLFLDKLVEPYSRFVLWVSPLYAGQLNEAFPQDGLLPAEAFVLRTAATPWQETLGALFRTGVQENYTRAPGWEAAVLGNTSGCWCRRRAPARANTPCAPRPSGRSCWTPCSSTLKTTCRTASRWPIRPGGSWSARAASTSCSASG